MEENDKIYCPKCGAEMSKEARYCMACGTLNYEHEANKNMRKFVPKNLRNTYQIGSGQFMVRNSQNQVSQSLSTRTGNKTLAFCLSYFLYLASLAIAFLVIMKGNYEFDAIVSSKFPLVALVLSILFFYLYAFELLFMKCNKEWWKALIPIYHLLEFSDIAFHKRWPGILLLVPILGQILFLVMLYQVGSKFNYSGLLISLFFPIGIPVVAFGVQPYEGYFFLGRLGEKELEREYRLKKIFLYTFFLFFFSGLGCMAYSFFLENGEKALSAKNYYYLYVAKQLSLKVEKEMKKENFTCNEAYSETKGTYYFIFDDVRTMILDPFSSLTDPIEGYVKVENTSHGSTYFVSIRDNNFGIPETDGKLLSLKVVEEKVTLPVLSGNLCTFSS
ncbi:MAG: zinc ribbon domain-containing protein [Bacilli bacterium]|nr:zinc ribbon domain-containing protein [Bacilli bacterium]